MSIVQECKDDFRNLIYVLWEHSQLPEPAPIQYDLAGFIADEANKRIELLAMRGAAKSMMACAYACYYLLRNPNESVLVLSASEPMSRDFGHLIRSWIDEVEVLRELRPNKKQRDNIAKFDVGCRTITSASPSVRAYGITGQITGGRAGLIIADDIETKDNAMTQVQREKLRLKMTELEAIVQPWGRIIVPGTPQTLHSLYFDLGYMIRRWPSRYPDPSIPSDMEHLSPFLRERLESGQAKPGEPTFPERYSHADLLQREASMGSSQFKLQFQVDPTLSDQDRYPLKLRDFIVLDVADDRAPVRVTYASGPNQHRKDIPSVGFGNDAFYGPMEIEAGTAEYLDSVMAVDPAGTGQDEAAWTIAKSLNGRIFVLANGAHQNGNTEEALDELAALCWQYSIKTFSYESNFGDDMYGKLVWPRFKAYYDKKNASPLNPRKIPPAIVSTRGKGQKELRIINGLEPLLNQHRLVISTKVAQDNVLMGQLTQLTRDRNCLEHDDRLDSLYQACNHFIEQMAVEQTKMELKLLDEEREASIKEFDKHRGRLLLFDPKPKKRKWIPSWP